MSADKTRLAVDVGGLLMELRQISADELYNLQTSVPGAEGVPVVFSVGAGISLWPSPAAEIELYELKKVARS